MLAIRLPEEIEKRLDALAKALAGPRPSMPAKPSSNIWKTWRIFILPSSGWPISTQAASRRFLLRK